MVSRVSRVSRMSHKAFARRILVAVAGSGAVLISSAAPAQATPPDCMSADLAAVMSSVSAATSVYLFTHPPVNDFITSLKGLPAEEQRAAMRAYGDANPQARAELQAIRQPTADFRARCG